MPEVSFTLAGDLLQTKLQGHNGQEEHNRIKKVIRKKIALFECQDREMKGGE